MNDSAYRVETLSRLAQWKIENISSCTYRRSDPFKIGKWNWYLSVEKNWALHVKLYPEITRLTRENPPIASFIIQVVGFTGDCKSSTHTETKDKQFKDNEDFVWAIEVPLTGKLIIDIEFLDLKTTYPNGGEPCSIWVDVFAQKRSNVTAVESLGRMLTEGIHTDIIINASDGSIAAHHAVLAGRSLVFRSMLSGNGNQKLSTLNIPDMSTEACQAFLTYLYGNIKREEFVTHRLALLNAANKYDIPDLKEACQESLLEDTDVNNVLEMLQNACLYHLPKVKISCMRYLVVFGKIFDVRNNINAFLQSADMDLIAELLHEILNAWKGF